MMAWKTLALGEVVRFRNGKSVKPGGEGPYAVFGSNGLIGRSTEFLYRNAIILGRVGAYCGSVAYCSEPFWASDNTIVVEPNEGTFDTRFAYYALTHANLARWAGGAAQPLVTQTGLKGVELRVPPFDIQRRIASILSAYDDLIEVNTRRIAILEEMARRIFEEWIVTPVGRLPMPSDRLTEWSLPQGWEFKRLIDLATIVMGQSPPSETYNLEGRGLPFHQGVTDFEAFFHRNRLYVEGADRPRIAEVGDILFSVRAPVGRIAIALSKMVLGRGLSAIRPAARYKTFIFCHLRSTFPRPDMIGDGAIYKAVTKDDVHSIPIVWPANDLADRLENQTGTIWSQIKVLYLSNATLRTARDLLLPKLISGEIDLDRAERETQRVAAE